MPFQEVDLEPFSRGLYIPDSNNETPPGSLTYAENILLTGQGGIRQRPGTAIHADTYSTFGYAFLHEPSTLAFLKADGTGKVYTAGVTSLSAGSALASGPTNATGHCQMATSPTTPGTVRTYIAQYNAELVKFDGAAFTSLAANTSPKCRYLAKGMKSERMWAAGFDAGASLAGFTTNIGPSTMAWSDPASPESWPIANYQNFGNDNLNPITAIAEFSGQIFVFKNNRFWVVYSITSSGGVTTLNYRPVSGAGCIQPGAYAVTEVGIFFLGADGLYLTDGSTPVKISGNINGLFTGNLPAWTTYNRLLPLPVKSVSKFAVSGDWIYMMGGNTSSGGLQSSCTLAYNYRTQAWSYFTQSVAALLPMPWTDISYPLVVGVKNTGTNYQLFNYHPFLKTDNAAFMTAEAHLNWFQMPTGRGYVAMDTAKVHRLDAWGLGHCQVGAAYDFNVAASGWVDLRFSELPTGDVWDSGSVWGDGSDLTDVWGGAISSATDLLRLTPPSHKFAFNPPGRGRYVSLAFRKMSDATFFYIERPRMTLVTRTAPPR